MWILGRSLPLLVGSLVQPGDEYWVKFIKITQFLFAPLLQEDDLAILQELIMDHHQQFIALFPHNSVTPKLHYLLHMPRLIHL